MAEPQIYWDFTRTCATCGKTVKYVGGVQESHPCPEGRVLVIEGCGGTTSLIERAEQALDDYEVLESHTPAEQPEGSSGG